MFKPITALVGALALAGSVVPVYGGASRGYAWATDNRFATKIGNMPRIKWFHHWADGPISQMPPGVEYVPMFWGPKSWDKWNQRKNEMYQRTPGHLMAFNEPDVSSQANMDPYYAASLFMQEIFPWTKKGTLVGSPALVWKLDWMATFLSEIKKKGGYVNFMCLHWYGSWSDLAGFKKYITTAHSRFGIDIWVTELGITSASNPSDYQVKKFMIDAFTWMDTQPYIKRAAWFGCFERSKAPDAYATGKNALLTSGPNFSDMGFWYAYTKTRKRSLNSRHHLLSRANLEEVQARDEAEDGGDDGGIHCDDTCVQRNAAIAAWENSVEARDLLEGRAVIDIREPIAEPVAEPIAELD